MALPPNSHFHFHACSLPTVCTPKDHVLFCFLVPFCTPITFNPERTTLTAPSQILSSLNKKPPEQILGKEENKTKNCTFAKGRLTDSTQPSSAKRPANENSPFPLLLVSVRHRWCSLDVLTLAIPFHCTLTKTDRTSSILLSRARGCRSAGRSVPK